MNRDSLANAYYDFGNYKKALPIYLELLGNASDDSGALRAKIARCYLGLSKFEEAIAEAKNALSLDSKLIEACYALGVSQSHKQEYAAAEKVINQALEPGFESPLLHHGLGIVYMHQRKYNESIQSLDHAIGLDNLNWRSHLILAEVYRRMDDIDKAISENMKAVRIKPTSMNLHQLLISLALKYSLALRTLNVVCALILLINYSVWIIPLAIISLSITSLNASIFFVSGHPTHGKVVLIAGLIPVLWYLSRLILHFP
jgi:tetratricopeptide (TPR) repeat protein